MQMTNPADISCAKSGRVAYLASEQSRSRGSLRLANAPFNIVYKIPEGNRFTLLNGDQIVKIIAEELSTDRWQVTFKLSDGSEHVASPSEWTKQFVTANRPPVLKA